MRSESVTPRRGRLIRWLGHRGFGFIEDVDGSYFFHIAKLVSGTPSQGCHMTFNTMPSTKAGRKYPDATNVRVVSAPAAFDALAGK